MKTLKTNFVFALLISFLLSITSCFVIVPESGHRVRKNSNNPHTPNTTNPGHTKGRK